MQKIILLFLFTSLAFPQGRTSVLEDKIYSAVDALVANPNEGSLKKLETSEKKFKPKSKSELLAFVILQCNKAYYQNQFGQTQPAIESYEKAWQLFQENKLSNYDIVESCLKPLGNLYTIIGDYDNAENTIKHYFYISISTKNTQQIYAATLNLSNVYHNTGRAYESIELIAKTMKLENFSKIQKGILYNNLGNNLFVQNMAVPAQHAFEKSISLLSDAPTQSETLSNAYRNLAKLYALQQNFVTANLNMQKAEDSFYKASGKTPRKEAQFFYDKAMLYFMQNEFGNAQLQVNTIFKKLLPNYPKSGLPSKNILYAETILLDALDLQAELFLVKSQPGKALESYGLSFHIEELFQSLLVYENSKIITQIRNRNRTEKCIDIYYSLYQKENKTSDLESAFLLSEQTKSAVLKQSLSVSKVLSREAKLISEQLQNWNTIIVKEQQKLERADISKINEAIKKQNKLMLLLKSESNKTGKEAEHALKITDLYAKLDKDKAVMVEYFAGAETLYSFTLQNKTIQLQIIEKRFDKNSIIRGYLSFFKEANSISDDPKEFNHVSNSVYHFLKLPKKQSNKNLIIIPDGILNFLPFESLITQRSQTANFAKMHYLLNDFKIGYNNSADFYLNSVPLQHQKESILGVFPLFENSNLELAFSKKELQNLQSNFEGKYLDRQNATFENFKINAASYSVLHLSTHASSGDITEPASIKFYNQEVLYSEFYNLNLNPNLVVLSACETGIGKLYKAEGAMSVARGFQLGGAQNLLFSLWKVNDFTTSVLMENFYHNVKKGQSYCDANHQAKMDFLHDETIPNTKKSPYYWASFVYYGTLENQPKTDYFLWFSLLGGLIALLLLWKLFRRKKQHHSSH
jgi:CHAT domain-containing protein